jgi:6-pyruvoyltetrahydropterin/6-carboxytetrahydropterin synthase
MTMKIRRTFSFDAAHKLECYHGKCERLHGHTYSFSLTVEGPQDPEGMVMDFVELKRLVEESVLSRLDHAYLNDLIPQPTAENIAIWIWKSVDDEICKKGGALCEVEVWETRDASAVVNRGDIQ